MESPISYGFIGGIALIRHPHEGEKRWLTLKNDQRNQLEMVTALRLEEESCRESLDRELAWTLDLNRGKDYLISSMARLNIEEILSLPGDLEPVRYLIEFYVADPFGHQVSPKLESNSRLHWLTGQEILSGRGASGQTVDPRLVHLLNKYEIISPHQS